MKNPTRRNRNIGTVKQGHGQDNRLEIPESWHDARLFYEKLRSPVRLERKVGAKKLTFLVEGTLHDYRHSCTIDDICRLLGYVPRDDLHPLDVVVLRQPTRKQRILSSVWGRLSYYYEANECSGVAIILESQPRDGVLKWSTSLAPDDRRELDRLAGDGHNIHFGKKCITIQSTLESCRSTQLFGTVPHELGHHRHYRETNSDARYASMPRAERETAAYRYATQLAAKLKKQKKVPFERILDRESLSRDQLKPEWFE
jgi:hypothetical protein